MEEADYEEDYENDDGEAYEEEEGIEDEAGGSNSKLN